jgi:hypothetical protein
MSRWTLSALDDRPVRLTVDLLTALHLDLVAHADLLGHETRQGVEAAKLNAPMLARFMARDRGFASALRNVNAAPAERTSDAPKPENA